MRYQTKHDSGLKSRLIRSAMTYALAISFGSAWAGGTPRNDPHNNDCQGTQHGCPVASVDLSAVSLRLSDSPVGYKPPVGPEVRFKVAYVEFDPGHPANPGYSNIGSNWTTGWLAFITDNPTNPGNSVSLTKAGGGEAFYSGYNGNATGGTFAREERTGAILTLVSASPVVYKRQFPDGSQEIYGQSNGATGSTRYVFLTKQIDAHGNALTFTYDSSSRLTGVTDTIGQVTTLAYANTAYPDLITSVTDPFGRVATLAYDAGGELTSMTDAIGMQSTFTYGAATGVSGNVITAMTTPYGTTNFATWNDPGGANHRWITTTDPLGHTSKVEFLHGAPGIPFSESQTPSSMSLFNSYINYRNTFVWDGAAYAQAPADYTQAMIYHWLHQTDGQTSGTLESIKPPLENRTWYNYPGQPGVIYNGTLMQPSLTGRLMPDGKTQLTSVAFNNAGNPTSVTDPVGRTTTYGYDTNGIDLLTAQQKTASGADTVSKLTYNAQHEPLTSTDAAGQTTTLTYNAQGQPLTVLDALGHKTTLAYDSKGYLQTVTDANGKVVQTLTYDAVGRVATRTDSEGYTVAYEYDNLDRVTKETYPDKTTRIITWDRLDVASVADRLGRTTTYTHDAARNLIEVKDPLGRITKYGYDDANRLISLTDPAGNVTTWARDIEGRVISKTYPDNTSVKYTYDTVGRLSTRTDALGQVTTYAYATDNRALGKSYAKAVNATPNVSIAWDHYYPRVTSMVDGTGTTSYTYVQAGTLGALQRAREVGPDGAVATISYAYDALGRLSQRTVAGASETLTYDAIGRISNHTNVLGSFNYGYLGETGQTTSEQLVGGQVSATYAYEDNTGDRRLKQILHNTLNLTYTSDAADRVLSRVGTGLDDAYGYDDADRLTSVTSTTTATTGGGSGGKKCALDDHDRDQRHDKKHSSEDDCDHDKKHHDFDADRHERLAQWEWEKREWDKREREKGREGNRWDHDDDDGKHHTGGSSGTSTTTSTTVTYGYDVADNLLDITGGTYTLSAQANADNQLTTVTTNGSTATWAYDANGNVLNDGTNTYTWDAENRLLSITNNSTKAVSTFIYDGLSRRVSIMDSGTQTKYLWCDEDICAARSSTGVVSARYAPQGELDGSNQRYYLRDNIGSVMSMVDSTGASQGTETYDAYGRVISTNGSAPVFAYAGMFKHAASGLNLTHYRAYSANMGRWLSRDPIEESGGFNLYQYAVGAPVANTDAFGLGFCIYNISTGHMFCLSTIPDGDGGPSFSGTFASGNNIVAGCKNNEACTWRPGIGPIPQGLWMWDPEASTSKPDGRVLVPVPSMLDPNGPNPHDYRNDFRTHSCKAPFGPSRGPKVCSAGCITGTHKTVANLNEFLDNEWSAGEQNYLEVY